MDVSIEAITGFRAWDILSQVGVFGYGILAILLTFSVIAWAVILHKFRLLGAIRKESEKFLELYHENNDLGEVYAACVAFRIAPVVRVFKAGYLDLQRIRKDIISIKASRSGNMELVFTGWVEDFTSVLQETLIREMTMLEQFLIFLAIASSSAPLLGLLGTVWGVMISFWSVGMQGHTSLSVIAPGISAALVTTIGGLATAIPAAIAYNILVNRVKILSAEMECFASEFTSVVRKELRKTL